MLVDGPAITSTGRVKWPRPSYVLDGRGHTDKQMKTADALLSELVEHVRPPKGCPVKLKEWPANALTIRNWIAIRGDMPDAERERFDKKVVQLRQTDPHVDWSAVNAREDSRRVLLYLDQEK